MGILVILAMDRPKTFFELLKFYLSKVGDKIIFVVSMSINVSIIKIFGRNFLFLDQFLLAHEILNFQYFEKIF